MAIQQSESGTGMLSSTSFEFQEPLTEEEKILLTNVELVISACHVPEPSSEHIWSDWERTSKSLLRSHKLPAEAGYYAPDESGKWVQCELSDEIYRLQLAWADENRLFEEVAAFRGWQELSTLSEASNPNNNEIHTAAFVVSCCHKIEIASKFEYNWTRDRLIFWLGRKAGETSLAKRHQKTWSAGYRTREGGRRAAEATYGTEFERQARRAAMKEQFKKFCAAGLKRSLAKEETAKHFGVSLATIRRAVE